MCARARVFNPRWLFFVSGGGQLVYLARLILVKFLGC